MRISKKLTKHKTPIYKIPYTHNIILISNMTISNRFRNTLVLEPCPRWARDEIIHHFWKHLRSLRKSLHDDVFRVDIEEMDSVKQMVFLTFTTSNSFADIPSKIVQEICWALRKHIKPYEHPHATCEQLDEIFERMNLNYSATPFAMTVKIAEYNGNMVTYNIVNGENKGMNVIPINTQKFFDVEKMDFPSLVK
jgi:predicted nucleic acid-binding protein